MKRLQNKVAESKLSLPCALLLSLGVWFLAGLPVQGWWLQFGVFLASVWAVVYLANVNMLIRIYSRSVAVSFIALSCTAPFLFHALSDALALLAVLLAFLVLCYSYQDKSSAGYVYYTFLLLSLGSLADVSILFYVPLFWLLTSFAFYAISWRTWWASLFGLLSPYWCLLAWCICMREADFSFFVHHAAPLFQWTYSFLFVSDDVWRWLCLAFCAVLWVIGFFHFLINSYRDKIRVRQIYYSLASIGIYAVVLFFLQPGDGNLHLRIFMLTASVLFGHYWALTTTRLTNAVCCVVAILTIALTIVQLCHLLSHS